VDHDAATNDAGWAVETEAGDFGAVFGLALGVGNQVRHVPAVPFLGGVMAVCLAHRVEMPLRAARIRGAAIARFMDVETVLTWRQTGKLGIDLNSTAKIAESNVT